MPLFRNESLSPLTEETDEEIESEGEKDARPKGKKHQDKESDAVNSVELEQYTNLPYPIVFSHLPPQKE